MQEKRIHSVELRATTADGKKRLSGYAIRYGARSAYIAPNVRERIMPHAFRSSIETGQDINFCVEHERAALTVLGRVSAGNLRLRDDEYGLGFDLDVPDTTVGNDCYELVRAGILRGMSFAFVCDKETFADEYDEDEFGSPTDERCRVRFVQSGQLFEISAVAEPAYRQSSVVARNRKADEKKLADSTWRARAARKMNQKLL